MWSAWCLFQLLWIGFVWINMTSTVPETMSHVQIQIPVFQQHCAAKLVKSVDDCSVLCVVKSVPCVGGVCVLQPDEPVKCNTEKGGMLMLAKNPFPHWMCLCTDATFWSGPECNTSNPDVCEHGVLCTKAEMTTCVYVPHRIKK
ncbi:uncharacterized protein TNIN_228361 [Trichonephila inaurata madagascariensis]|uniref:Uncharacterized protein n=1 Tax=Trichonephila inaurata madagascariensis TaxID=2747483 RepID=A0A8X7CKB4_9ARAC|nr:uncharacterized protein TNIN_228361 [Trichonephila inaurata madagascariensis]